MPRDSNLLRFSLWAIAFTPWVTACSSAPTAPPVAEHHAPFVDRPELADARAALDRGDYEGAQGLYAKATSNSPRDAAAWAGFAKASEKLYEWCLQDSRRGNPLFYLQDAEQGLSKALELDPLHIPTLLFASQLQRRKGDGPAASTFAQRARDAVEKSTPAQVRFDVLLELGLARASEYQQSVRNSESPIKQAELYQRAVDAFRSARAVLPGQPEPVIQLAAFEYARGARSDALQILLDAIRDTPEEFRLHQYFCDLSIGAGLLSRLTSAYEGELSSLAEKSPTTTWYCGYVKMREAEKFRTDRDFGAASAAYEKACAHLKRSAEMNPQFEGTVRTQTALATAGMAKLLLDQRRVADAARKLTDAFEMDIRILNMPDGLGVTPLAVSGDIGLEYFNNRELEEGARWFERWLQIQGDVVSWLNKAALMRRDLGEELSRAGNDKKARACFELSYQCYEKACRLMPDEPRLLNDTALILLYHLNRDLDRAEAMFQKSIDLGEAKLAQLGPRPEDDESHPENQAAAAAWDYFAEAFGDAHQNLALLLWQKGGESAEIRKLLEKSLEYDPRSTRARLREYLKQLPAAGPAPKLEGPLR